MQTASLNVPKYAWIILNHFSLLRIYITSNIAQNQLKINSNQLKTNSTRKMRSIYFFLIELPSNHPRFLKIYSIAFLLKNQHPENTSKSTQNGFVDNRVMHRSKWPQTLLAAYSTVMGAVLLPPQVDPYERREGSIVNNSGHAPDLMHSFPSKRCLGGGVTAS
jgi:hypothetical protein